MLPDVVSSSRQPLMEQLSSPLSAHRLEFFESDLFQEAMQNSEVSSSSEQSSFLSETTATAAAAAPTTTNFSSIFEEEIMENDISTPLDLTNASHFTNHRYPFSNHDQFDIDLIQKQTPLIDDCIDTNTPIVSYTNTLSNDHVVPAIRPMRLPTVCEESCLSSMPPLKFMRLHNPVSPNYSFIDASMDSYNLTQSMEGCGIFNGNLPLRIDSRSRELEFQGDNGGMLCPDPPPRAYNSNELQALSNESQHHVHTGGSSTTPLVSEITTLDSEPFRFANKLTSEERKEKIQKYLKKRNQRNFSKKIKYTCRKTLADSRPRVRGRFAKNDEFGENNRSNSSHEEDIDENVVVKDEEERFESPDIFAHISGLNSFKYNYPIQSWR